MQDRHLCCPPTFSLASQWSPHFFHSRIATVVPHGKWVRYLKRAPGRWRQRLQPFIFSERNKPLLKREVNNETFFTSLRSYW